MEPFDPAADPRAYRRALGAFATGVTVVTADSPEGPVGITANSFASVSLNPPLVLWMPARESNRFALFETAEHFAVHVLHRDQREICDAFTRDRAAWDGLDWQADANGVPDLAGCLARFQCRTHATHDGGDHLIVVGRVTAVTAREGMPLLFHGGRFVSFHG